MSTRAVYVGPTRSLALSDSDMLWAARGCLGEGGSDARDEVLSAYLWAVMRRCLLLNNRLGYGAMWRAFSQPINPKWQEDGEFCTVGGKYHGKPECSSDRLSRRARISATPWEAIPAQIRDAVERFSIGALPPPMLERTLPKGRDRLSNWASYPGVQEKYPQGIELDGEWFLEDQGLMDGDVKIDGVVNVMENPSPF